jgi:hypothetical protein
MKALKAAIVGILVISAFARGAGISETQKDSIATLYEILLAIYENDPSQLPDEPNEILGLEVSLDPRDQLALELFKLIRYEMDPNSRPEEAEISSMNIDDSLSFSECCEANSLSFIEIEGISGLRSLCTAEAPEELTGPLGSCILENKTYRITELPLQIEGHVVIPAGTRLIAPYDPNHPVIEVLPGGLLDTGKAAFYTEEEYPDILPPVEIVPEDPNIQFYHNNVGIYVHRGADRKTRIENIIIENCIAGLVIDEALDYPLRQVITVGCYDGVQVYAPAGITDCLFWYNGSVYYDIFGYPGSGIYVWMDWEGDTPEVAIDRTTVYSADVALYIEGGIDDPNATDPNDVVPSVRVVNSCLSGSGFFGVYQSPGEGMIEVQYCGFGGNYLNTNIALPLTGCLELADIPFYNRPEDWKKLYIEPESWLIDAGYGMATDGMGVGHDRPDTGVMDIGCHYALGLSGGYGIQSSAADFNWDGVVDEADLALMDMCMGAVTDPNIVRLDGNYDSRVNLPDFGRFATDYGYCGDPNFCTNNDPNCMRSDFNGDDWVDIEDLAILAEHWLAVVFDEYRICSLCNLHTGGDPNDPNAPDGREVIDANDMAAFMAEWGVSTDIECRIAFETADSNSVEPNQLSGVITIHVEDCLPSTWMFVQVDGMPAGETYADTGMPLFTIPTYEFSNGYHLLTIGGYTHQDGCWIQEFPAIFDNRLYYASIPDMYEPNEVYEITGYFDDGTVEISTDPNTSTVSDNGYIKHSSIINTASAEATLTYENGMSAETQTVSLMAAIDMSKKDPNVYRAWIIAPFEDANDDFNVTLETIRTSLKNRSISYDELIGKNANWDNISIALRGDNLNYVYWIGHTNSRIGETRNLKREVIEGEEGVNRTNFKCWDKGKFWGYSVGKIFSCLQSDRLTNPPVLDSLPNNWEAEGHSMWSLRLWKTNTIKEFWAIGCETGLEWQNAGITHNYNDMAAAIGAYYSDQQGNYFHVYMGNRTPVWFGGLLDQSLSYPNAIAHVIQRHTYHDLEDALVNGPLNSNERTAVWGIDLDKNGLTDNVLQWWPVDTKLDWINFY